MVQTTATDAAGTRTVVSMAYDAGGALAFSIKSVNARNGLDIDSFHDDDDDGVIDRIQTVANLCINDRTFRLAA